MFTRVEYLLTYHLLLIHCVTVQRSITVKLSQATNCYSNKGTAN